MRVIFHNANKQYRKALRAQRISGCHGCRLRRRGVDCRRRIGGRWCQFHEVPVTEDGVVDRTFEEHRRLAHRLGGIGDVAPDQPGFAAEQADLGGDGLELDLGACWECHVGAVSAGASVAGSSLYCRSPSGR